MLAIGQKHKMTMSYASTCTSDVQVRVVDGGVGCGGTRQTFAVTVTNGAVASVAVSGTASALTHGCVRLSVCTLK